MSVALCVRQNFRTGNDDSFAAAFSTRRRLLPESHPRLFTTVLNGESCDRYGLRSTRAPALNVCAERCDSARSDLRRPTSTRSFLREDRDLSWARRAATLVRTTWGRERPPSRQGSGPRFGDRTGVAHALHHHPQLHPRGLSGGKERRHDRRSCASATRRGTGTCDVHRCPRSARFQQRDPPLHGEELKGDNSNPRRCPPFCPTDAP